LHLGSAASAKPFTHATTRRAARREEEVQNDLPQIKQPGNAAQGEVHDISLE
jgi:hypothetical protein